MTPCTTKLMTKPTKLACLSVAFTLILATGCTSKTAPTPENYTQTLNAWFLEHSDCLFPDSPHFPFETTDPVKTRQMDSLVTGQLLARTNEPARVVLCPERRGARLPRCVGCLPSFPLCHSSPALA